MCSPIISEECRYLQLAPYNTHYDILETHLHSAGIRTELTYNHWNSPLYINQDNSSTHYLCPPKDFSTFVIPFKLQEDSVSVFIHQVPLSYIYRKIHLNYLVNLPPHYEQSKNLSKTCELVLNH